MSNKKQTAVEWVSQELDKYNKEPWKYGGKDGNMSKAKQNIIEQAKAMHKEEIINAWNKNPQGFNHSAENYYKETYEQ